MTVVQDRGRVSNSERASILVDDDVGDGAQVFDLWRSCQWQVVLFPVQDERTNPVNMEEISKGQ